MSDLQDRAAALVHQEVFCCMSQMVSRMCELQDEQAYELAAPISDYEEAARQAGWTGPHTDEFGVTYFEDTTDGQTWAGCNWDILCLEFDIESYDREVFEHWAVSTWLAEKLTERGEKVDTDFCGLCVWARTTTGQAISSDHVIEQIVKDLIASK